jgi:hypothetical protein
VKTFLGLSSDRAYKRFYPAIDPLISWSRYLEQLRPYFIENLNSDRMEIIYDMKNLLSRGEDIQQMMQVTGEEGISLDDFKLQPEKKSKNILIIELSHGFSKYLTDHNGFSSPRSARYFYRIDTAPAIIGQAVLVCTKSQHRMHPLFVCPGAVVDILHKTGQSLKGLGIYGVLQPAGGVLGYFGFDLQNFYQKFF